MDAFVIKFTLFVELCILTLHLYKEVHQLEGGAYR